ncbi:hypothetical protein MGA3_10735 [Bacillus methanolicus MGA3]|nr:hypothetical protein MGA3_10735 [Bacillus methanolicus MGA3]
MFVNVVEKELMFVYNGCKKGGLIDERLIKKIFGIGRNIGNDLSVQQKPIEPTKNQSS